MKMVLTVLLRILNAFFQDVLGLLHKLAVQVNRILGNTATSIVFAENELRGLLVILLHLATMGLSLLGELLGPCAVAIRVGFFRLGSSQGQRCAFRPCISAQAMTMRKCLPVRSMSHA